MDGGRGGREARAVAAAAGPEERRDGRGGRAAADVQVRGAVVQPRVVPLVVERRRGGGRAPPEEHGRARGPDVVQVPREGAVRAARQAQERLVAAVLREVDEARVAEPRGAGRRRAPRRLAAAARLALEPGHDARRDAAPLPLREVRVARADVEEVRPPQREVDGREALAERLALALARGRRVAARLPGQRHAAAPERAGHAGLEGPRGRRGRHGVGPAAPRVERAEVGVRGHDAPRRVPLPGRAREGERRVQVAAVVGAAHGRLADEERRARRRAGQPGATARRGRGERRHELVPELGALLRAARLRCVHEDDVAAVAVHRADDDEELARVESELRVRERMARALRDGRAHRVHDPRLARAPLGRRCRREAAAERPPFHSHHRIIFALYSP